MGRVSVGVWGVRRLAIGLLVDVWMVIRAVGRGKRGSSVDMILVLGLINIGLAGRQRMVRLRIE